MIYFNWTPGPFLATLYDKEPGGAGFEATCQAMHGDAVKARPGRECQRSLATCQAMHGDAVKARPGREKTKMVAAQGSNSSVSTLRIRFLPLVAFSVLSCTFSEHYRKKSVDQRPPKSKA